MVAPADTGAGPPEPRRSNPAHPPKPPDRPVRAPAPDAGRDGTLGPMGLAVAALGFLCAVFNGGLVGALYAGARGLSQTDTEGDLGFHLATLLGSWVGFLVIPLLWAARQGGVARVLGLAGRWVDVALGVAVGLGSTAVTAVVSSTVLSTAEQKALEAKALKIIDLARGPVGVTVLVVALCVATPLAEEVFFRGLLFRSLHRLTSVAVALPIAAAVFGVVHYSGGPAKVVLVQLGLLSLFGAALCTLVLRTGRLAAAIVAHGAFNAVTVVTLLAQR